MDVGVKLMQLEIQCGSAPEQTAEVQAASWCGGGTDYLRGEELDEVTLEEGREERTEDREGKVMRQMG